MLNNALANVQQLDSTKTILIVHVGHAILHAFLATVVPAATASHAAAAPIYQTANAFRNVPPTFTGTPLRMLALCVM